ncbi:hypothetical protein JCM8547_008338 [Rhodosporidiobolus lusitaniae]
MSTCSFTSFLSMRAQASSSGNPGAAASSTSAGGPLAAFHSHPVHRLPASISPFDLSEQSGSPHKRQRNTSPDHSAQSSASTLRAEASSYFSYAAVEPSPLQASTSSSTSSSESTPCAPRSILCTPSSPLSSNPSSPFTSPPCSRPLSRRSSTSKSVRFARCTNASVFPTHSTEEYDRSPIIPTSGSESLELKRSDDDDDGGWVQCHVRDKKKECVKADGPQLPKHSPAMENPVEGVHGLIEGGFFVGDSAERDGRHPALREPMAPMSTACTSFLPPGAIPEALPEVEHEDELELELNLDLDSGGYADDRGDDDDLMVVDDSAESADSHQSTSSPLSDDSQPVPRLVRTGSLSDDDTSADESALRSSSASPELESEGGVRVRRGSASSAATSEGEEEEGGAERRKAECKKRFGLCALGKFSRSDLFLSHDSLGGF